MATSEDQVTVEYRGNSDPEAGDGAVEMTTPGEKHAAAVLVPQRRNSRIPILFERAAKSWWDPKFDSRILERHHSKTYFNQIRTRFRYALGYIILSCIAWCIFFGLTLRDHWISFLIGSIILVVITAAVLGFTFVKVYKRLVLPTSVLISVCLCIFSLLSFVYPHDHISAVGKFTGVIEILLMIYTVIPLPLYLSVILGVLLSVIFEVISGIKSDMNDQHLIVGRVLLHICIHLIGIHIFIMSQVRKRSTFLKVGQSIMSRKDLEFEKQLQHQMIHSLMPPQVAAEVMKSRGQEDKKEEEENVPGRQKQTPEIPSFSFRSFHMTQMDDTSILFADIVGFTKMSSNKTAEHLVSLLNDLFGRFDVICSESGCEKISTLGDCYYCVSGCPTPKPDHAQCCVEMGLAMCKAIEEFDRDHKEEVDMRVGVHTGMVLCGLVGTRRFKFDVWSHDVTLANTMESSGEPGRVHISDATYNFVKDSYEVEAGKDVTDIRSNKKLTECFDPETQQYIVKHVEDTDVIKTWFIKSKKKPADAPDDPAPAEEDQAEPVAVPEEVQITVEETKETQEDPKPAEEVEANNSQKESLEKSQTNHLETSQLVSLFDVNIEPNLDVNESDNAQTDPLLPVQPTDNNNLDKPGHRGNSPPPHIDGNEMSTASLLGKRDVLATSIEDLDTDNKETTDTALFENLVIPRLHEQSDKQLISRMESDQSRTEEYLYRPPINQCTLKFTDSRLEAKYHNHYLDKDKDTIRTLALPKFSALSDMIVSCIFFILVSVCCFLGFQPYQVVWIVIFAIAMCFEMLMLLPLLCVTCSMEFTTGRMKRFFSSWYIRHIFGFIIASLPALAVFVNFQCSLTQNNTSQISMFYCLLLISTLLHYCNFTMLSSWMKSCLATIAGVALLVLYSVATCSPDSVTVTYDYLNETVGVLNTTLAPAIDGGKIFKHEIILDIILFLFLIWFLNREFEISYRLSFHGDQQALMDRQNMQVEKEQADWLLHNIIPEHVADIVKKTSKYCENHKDVGVVFASVTNFDNFYDESFEGGKEYLRVLNELMGDFEDLFDNPKYKDIEKIKTIGSCLMASAGLNPQTRKQNKDPTSHLYALMDFCIDLLEKLEQFNAEIFNFDFEMKIGFNFGEVTSGVIGTTKLLYDIWGDTVNISSRMYSTGVQGKIQVTGYTATKLQDKFDFEYRGKIYVKGKGDMDTYILSKKKPDAVWD